MSQENDLIYGAHPVAEALEAGRPIDRILLKQDTGPDLRRAMLAKAKEAGVPVQFVPREKLDRLSRGAVHQGVIAQLPMVEYADIEETLEAIQEAGRIPLVLMLDQLTDVRNLGAIARTAECMGVDLLVFPSQGAARVNADAMKISAGALNHLPVARVDNLPDAVLLCQAYGLRIVSCHEGGETSYHDFDFRHSTCLIMGAEDKGISGKLQKMSDFSVKIPLKGNIDSLNVSVATGMILGEVARQRG